MGTATYRHQLRGLKDRLAAVNDHPRLADIIYCAEFARRHQLAALTARAVSLGA